jgi:receptor protein-tyrosine kinase
MEEAFRVARSNLLVALQELERPTVIFTSAQPGEGKTMTCVHMAASLAMAGQRVVLIDVDMRNPGAHRMLRTTNEVGLADVLVDRKSLDEALQFVELGENARREPVGLYFLAAGTNIVSPTELLATPRMPRLLDSLARQADIVLLDCPPILPVADTLVIGRMAAGAVLVVEARRTPVEAVQSAKDALIRNQTRLLGIILNKTRSSDQTIRYGYGNYYPSTQSEESLL